MSTFLELPVSYIHHYTRELYIAVAYMFCLDMI